MTSFAPPAASAPPDAQSARTTPTVLVSVPSRPGRTPIAYYNVREGDGPTIGMIAYDRSRITRTAAEDWGRRNLGPDTEYSYCEIPDRVNLAKTCHYGHRWCKHGQGPHQDCGSGWLELSVPGFHGTTGVLCAQIGAYGEDPQDIELSLSGDGMNGCRVTGDQLRAIVADGRRHLDQLAQLADQYDALVGAA